MQNVLKRELIYYSDHFMRPKLAMHAYLTCLKTLTWFKQCSSELQGSLKARMVLDYDMFIALPNHFYRLLRNTSMPAHPILDLRTHASHFCMREAAADPPVAPAKSRILESLSSRGPETSSVSRLRQVLATMHPL